MSKFVKILGLVASVIALAGCAAPPVVAPLAAAQLWQDEVFHYRADRVPETRQTLFDLEPAILASIHAGDKRSYSTEQRLTTLMRQLYGENGIRLSYTSGHTTGATQTWNDKRGDCLSLTIMVYAAARSLGLPAQMQEVRVPMAVDRHGGIDFISGHVNVFVRTHSSITVNGRSFDSSGIVVDFDLQPGSRNMGRELGEDEILARYYNNRATEFLVQKDVDNAYAYYRAAIEKDPHFAPVYANLAQLYYRGGMAAPAEQLLRHALALKDDSYAPLRAMQELLVTQGRTAEAKVFADQLRRRQDDDPYYWLALGLDAMARARYREAAGNLERAAALTTGFEEIHVNLAISYARSGQRDKAQQQLSKLETMTHDSTSVALLSKKLERLSAQSAVF
jgi:tetratricopeptide (TPR) repeat protein